MEGMGKKRGSDQNGYMEMRLFSEYRYVISTMREREREHKSAD